MRWTATAEIPCQNQSHRISMTANGKVILRDHPSDQVVGERVMCSLGGTPQTPCFQLDQELRNALNSGLNIPTELLNVLRQIEVLGPPIEGNHAKNRSWYKNQGPRYLLCKHAKLQSRAYRENLISQATTATITEMKRRGWELFEKDNVQYFWDPTPVRRLYRRKDCRGANLIVGCNRQDRTGIGTGLFFLFETSKEKPQTLMYTAVSGWEKGVRTADLLKVADLFERGLMNLGYCPNR